jgi:hypothetical protein
MATAIPMDVFELLEKKVGRDEAKEVIKHRRDPYAY